MMAGEAGSTDDGAGGRRRSGFVAWVDAARRSARPVTAGALMLVMSAPGQTAVVSVFVDPMIIGLSLDRATRWRLRQDWWAPVC